jgi:hypothetical protein
MGEVDDVEHAENDREAEAEQGVERAIDQPEKKLAEQRLSVDAKHDDAPDAETMPGGAMPPGCLRIISSPNYFFTNEQVLWDSGVNASSAGMVAISL